jgi:hypothetical protein
MTNIILAVMLWTAACCGIGALLAYVEWRLR